MIRVLFIALVLTAGCSAALDVPRMADAFNAKETGPSWDGRDGLSLERGPFQLREITWRQHMGSMPFAMARKPGPARACALKHIAWLVESLEARHVDVTPFNVAAAWNAGLDTYTHGRAEPRAYHYAADVERLYLKR